MRSIRMILHLLNPWHVCEFVEEIRPGRFGYEAGCRCGARRTFKNGVDDANRDNRRTKNVYSH